MRRYLLLALLLIFVLLSSGLALAQDDMQGVYCGALSEQDCDLLMRNKDFALSSAHIDFSFNMDLTAENESFSLSGTGSGAFVGAPALTTSLQDMQPAITTLQQIELAVNVMRDLDAEMTLSITVPESMAELPADVDSIDLEVKLVDGIGYVNLDTLAPLMGSAGENTQMQGWAGLDIVGLLDALMEEHPELFESMGSSTQTLDPELIMQFQNPERIKDYVDIQRTSADGAPVAVFETTVDMAALVDDPAFTELMLQAMEAQVESQPGLTEAERQQAVEIGLGVVKHMTVSATQAIDAETAATVSMDVNVSFDNSEQPSDDFGVMMMDVNFNLAYDDVNAVESIEAPEDATVLPVETLLQMWNMDSNSN
ncbi:MAG: hypothetical protein IT320_18745 [Anaerolineae bacterium]|nr:hypothetical protein [Anaerolineae bacterium]